MQNKPTKGEVNLYNQIKGGTVRALLGKSSAGDGWRPVCAGVYLGNECKTTEKAAIAYGNKFMEQLKNRVEPQSSDGCGACDDGCHNRSQCRLIEESPPTPPTKRKRKSKKQECV